MERRRPPHFLVLILALLASAPAFAGLRETLCATRLEPTLDGMVQLLESRDLIPEGGRVHVRGPSFNFTEWLLPLLVRADINVSISEPLMKHRLGNDEYFGYMARKFFAQLQEQFPAIAARYGIQDAAAFHGLMTTRLKAYETEVKAIDAEGQADLVVSILPLQSWMEPRINPYLSVSVDLAQHVRPGGHLWYLSPDTLPTSDYIWGLWGVPPAERVSIPLPLGFETFIPHALRVNFEANDDAVAYFKPRAGEIIQRPR